MLLDLYLEDWNHAFFLSLPPFPVERRVSLRAELSRFVVFPSHSVKHQTSSLPLSCHPVAWAAGLLQGCSWIKCSGASNTLTLGPWGQFLLTKRSGLPLSHRVNQDCQETVGIVAVRNQHNFCSLSPPGYFQLRNLGSFWYLWKPLHNGMGICK